MPRRATQLRFGIVILSLLVFFLALNAKLSAYDYPPSVNGPSSAKLWLNGQKMEAQTPSSLVLAIFSVAFIFLRPLREKLRWPRAQFQTSTPTAFELLQLHRFLRPPPAI
ncbi:MAG TPA: hypothetical protein VNX88_18340 [Terriglobales bacterium]|nr:hypothetical protein [Terriglobales bacterium]